jgi:hypothetical protein
MLWGLAAVSMMVGAALMLGVPQVGRVMETVSAPIVTAGQDHAPAGDLARLSEEIARLSADRDKLIARLELLERQVGAKTVAATILSHPEVPAITGSVGRVTTTTPPGSGATSAPLLSESHGIQDGPVRRIVFGIDLGSASSVDRLRDRWTAMSDLFGPILAKLEPRVVFGHNKDGAVELRLLAGPFPNAELAVKACSEMQRQPGTCEPRAFDGEPLSKS